MRLSISVFGSVTSVDAQEPMTPGDMAMRAAVEYSRSAGSILA
jgi:hypothetical protein